MEYKILVKIDDPNSSVRVPIIGCPNKNLYKERLRALRHNHSVGLAVPWSLNDILRTQSTKEEFHNLPVGTYDVHITCTKTLCFSNVYINLKVHDFLQILRPLLSVRRETFYIHMPSILYISYTLFKPYKFLKTFSH